MGELIIEDIKQLIAASDPNQTKEEFTYPEGIYVAEINNEIRGYASSVLWNKKAGEFSTYEEIENFEKHHNTKGKPQYVIFVGVEKKYRRQGIGSQLIQTIQANAITTDLKKVQVVAGPVFLPSFYSNLGFKEKTKLIRFAPNIVGTLMEYYIK